MQNPKQFITDVMQGLWSDWIPTREELDILNNALKHLDYEPAQTALRNWLIEQTIKSKNLPLNKIIQLFRKVWKNQLNKGKCVLLFTIIKERLYKEGKRHNSQFWGNMREPAVIEKDAEYRRQQANNLYEGNHIIIRNWDILKIK